MKLRTAGGRQKKKRFNKIIGIVDTGLITSSTIAGGTSIPAFASDVVLPVGAILGVFGGTSFPFNDRQQKSSRRLTVKQGKHDAIMLLAQSKLDSIVDIISQATEDRDISPTEFHKVLHESKKYRKLKADIRNRIKAKVKQIEKHSE